MSDVGSLPAGLDLTGGQAAGGQAQTNVIIQLMRAMLAAMQGNVPGVNFFQVYAFTGVGDLNIPAAFPAVQAGIFSIRKLIAAPTTVTLPATGGPYAVADGNGACAPGNQITVQAAGGVTILGASSYFMISPWQFTTFILDGTNYLPGL